ncbi:hypothetical protein CGRA01v4_12760 [Colletotrichum graminicola]|nr:hypothetical protein CGRA01v4_12760 [Colletotrichum graminicola]
MLSILDMQMHYDCCAGQDLHLNTRGHRRQIILPQRHLSSCSTVFSCILESVPGFLAYGGSIFLAPGPICRPAHSHNTQCTSPQAHGQQRRVPLPMPTSLLSTNTGQLIDASFRRQQTSPIEGFAFSSVMAASSAAGVGGWLALYITHPAGKKRSSFDACSRPNPTKKNPSHGTPTESAVSRCRRT